MAYAGSVKRTRGRPPADSLDLSAGPAVAQFGKCLVAPDLSLADVDIRPLRIGRLKLPRDPVTVEDRIR